MDTTPAIQAYVIISFGAFVAFALIIFVLLVNLQLKKNFLKKARAELEDYSANLEQKVEERTFELRASEGKYRNLFDNSKEAVLIVKVESSEIIDANIEAESLFGYGKEQLLEMRFDELLNTDVLANRIEDSGEQILRRADGSTRLIDCVTGKINYSGMLCLQIICRDITERRQLEIQLIQNQKMAALGQLAAGVAHELNTPLGTIYSSNYFNRTEVEDQRPVVQKHFELVETQIEKCRAIINDLLNFSRMPSPHLELRETDLNDVLETCLEIIGKEVRSNNIALTRELKPIPKIIIDSTRINQVFLNIILNAIQAMPSGGSLHLKSWCDRDISSLLDINQEMDVVHVSFEDTGVGIPKELTSEIFNPFFTTKKAGKGIGLGLSISYNIVRQFHGSIRVESVPGIGTKFTVDLPVIQ